MTIPLIDLQAQYATIRDEVRAAIDRVFETQQFVLSSEVQALEAEIASYSQTRFAIACASGSDALLLALMSCGIGEGDEVITSPFTFFATASAIARVGARPVFADIDERIYTIAAERIEQAITNRTKAIIPVHIYGQCADMDPLLSLAARHGLAVIEDAAQAIGAEDRGRRAGSMGTIGCFSFYPSKNLGGAGDGGMLVTNDQDHAERLSTLRVHGEEKKYHHQLLGINSRLDALQAVVLRVKFPHLEAWTAERHRRAQQYEIMFADAGLSEILKPPVVRKDGRHVFHQYVIRLGALQRDRLREHLRANGILADVYYPVPLHLQKSFAYLGYQKGDFPSAEAAADETLALPVYPELTCEQQEFVVSKIVEALA